MTWNSNPRRLRCKAAIGLWIALAVTASLASPTPPDSLRTVEGVVVDSRGNLLPKAVVYLENTATLLITSYICQEDGKYHFEALNPEVDYLLSARYRTYRSKSKRISKFDSAQHLTLNLTIPAE